MRLLDFFNLSIFEVEEYIKSCTTFDSMVKSTNLAECLSLTGINNFKLGRSGRIRVAKKPNPHRIYFMNMICVKVLGEPKYWISFTMFHEERYFRGYLIGISPETLEITNIKCHGETYRDLDKTKKLKEFLDEYY